MGRFGRTEIVLWMVTVVCGVASVAYAIEARVAHGAGATIEMRSDKETLPKTGEVMGRLEIRDLGLSVPMVEGYDDAALLRGVGHVAGTAVPGGLGNMVLAGHRDTYFRPLRRMHAGLEMRVFSKSGMYRYVVDSTEVVMPDAVRVLDVGQTPEMTLITCYPFEFIGAAPKRFIVHAHLVSVAPERGA